MKALLFILFFFFTSNTSINIEEIRESYKICNASKENADQFYKLTQRALQNKGAIFKGYHGAALALKASFAWNPFNKLSYFNKGRKMIDTAIKSEPDNIELRMIRLSIQSNAPRIVGYYKNIQEDKEYILKNVADSSPNDLKIYIEGFIQHSGEF